jgi:hypothetical protein
MKKTLERGKLRVELDKSEVFLDDPGRGTPAVVYHGDFSATYWCAVGEGELIDSNGYIKPLTELQIEWLDSINEDIDLFLYGNMNADNLLQTINKTQDGCPLGKYIRDGKIDYSIFGDIESLSFSDSLNLLLLKSTNEDEASDALSYAIQELQRAFDGLVN